ncbi:glycoprotein [Achromobacter insolitus]|uniref:DUF6246 family protein n=1 Tax=Achromobacter insolitus TaxID=217204 RepID=UPI0007C7C470|nr:DUF6246 family protein [Achromobacter insolitus]OAE52880.1 glycoprotein [Achromobacter insolitus]OCZ50634.1 glycoprotein [Achromobacter insolitus]
MILTEIGEVGVYAGEAHYVLRPSLYAMSRIGPPAEIVSVYASVMGEAPPVIDALGVIYACSGDDLTEIFGHVAAEESGGLTYVPGRAPVEHIVHIARCLLKHGVTGALPELPRRPGDEPEYVKEFDARAHVALAMAHLSMSEREAWDTTMTALVGALRAKFPRPESNAPGSKAPSKEEHEATMEWFERVECARQAQSFSVGKKV